MKLDTATKIKLGIGVGAAVGVYMVIKEVLRTKRRIAAFVSDPENPINTGANEFVKNVTGNKTDSIGTHIFAILNPEEASGEAFGPNEFPGFRGVDIVEEELAGGRRQ